MRKIFVLPLVVAAFVVGYLYGIRRFVEEMADLHGCSTEEWTRWYKQQKQKQQVMERFR